MLARVSFKQSCLIQNIAQVRSAQLALAVERYRMANGGTPESAGQLVPAFFSAVPVDPCNGQPLGYRPVEDGYIVFSAGAGPHGTGGMLSSGQNRDFVFRVTHSR